MLDKAMQRPERAFEARNARYPAFVIIESLHKLSSEEGNRTTVSHYYNILICQ